MCPCSSGDATTTTIMSTPNPRSGQSKRPEQPREFAFISGRASSGREKSRISQLAHRHTARVVNRQRKLLRTQTSPGSIESNAPSTGSGLFGEELHASARSASVPINNLQKHGQVVSFDRDTHQALELDQGATTAEEVTPAVNWQAISMPSFNQKEELSTQMLRYLWLQSRSSPTRSLDPALGPLVAGMLQSASEPVYSIGIHHRKGMAYVLRDPFANDS